VLDDGNAGPEQQGMRGPLEVGGVVDVDRVDADERRVLLGEPGRAVPGQEVRVGGVLGGAEPGGVAGVQQPRPDVLGKQPTRASPRAGGRSGRSRSARSRRSRA
jgi:hypothetical protein